MNESEVEPSLATGTAEKTSAESGAATSLVCRLYVDVPARGPRQVDKRGYVTGASLSFGLRCLSPLHHHHVKDSALVPATQPAYAPAIDVVADRNEFPQAKEFRLDLRSFLHSAT